jgi:NAD(P)-dependent dehydrogenase (short-subunit alcohol dehydrogenase family)
MLAGKTVLITGASSGFGEHFARVARKAGANVAICARRLPRLESLAAELNKDGRNEKVVAAEMDVNVIKSIRAAFDSVEASLGTVDILVNNSGIANPKLALEMEEVRKVVKRNGK